MSEETLANALNELSSELAKTTHEFCDVIKKVEIGCEGIGVDAIAEANSILEEYGYKLIIKE